jgi:hypothetical protein
LLIVEVRSSILINILKNTKKEKAVKENIFNHRSPFMLHVVLDKIKRPSRNSDRSVRDKRVSFD